MMAEGRKEKKFEHDWWRAKVCPLGFHIGGRPPKENTLQNAYMTTLFETFGTKSFSSRLRVFSLDQEFGQDENGNPNYDQ
jgi:hypothetical protein